MNIRDGIDIAVLGTVSSVLAWVLGHLIGGSVVGICWATLTMIVFGFLVKQAIDA